MKSGMSGDRERKADIQVVGKELIQIDTGKSHPRIWFGVSVLLLLLEMEGILGAVMTGWNLAAEGWVVFLATAVFVLLAAVFFYEERLEGKRRYLVFVLVLAYAVLLFVTQGAFVSGAKQFVNGVVSAVNRQYNSSIAAFAISMDAGNMTVFLTEIMLLLTFLLGAVVIWRPDALILALVEFPFLVVLFLCSADPSMPSLFALLFAAVGVFALSRSFRRKQLWGDEGSEQRKRNLACFENVQKKILILVGAAGVLLSIFAFYLVRPGLDVQLERAEHLTAQVENRVMEALISVLPQSAAGSLTMTAETEGGGVQDGVLGETDGFSVGTLEDLKLTSSAEPTETVYLKGFIGSTYEGNRWLPPAEETFDSAATNWRTEGDPSLYIQNLPFLRAMYAENAEGTADSAQSGMEEMTVERLNAVSTYTYLPYNAYLNEYYEVSAGDGAVEGQSIQDDIFSYYPMEKCREILEAWDSDEDSGSVLDRVEASYEAYAKQWYLDVPDGFDDLKQLCEEQDFHVDGTGDIPADSVDDVAEFVVSYLTENYTYDMNAEAVPEGEDFLTWFLEESGTGYSTHFATAAVMMFRMCGMPARYVAGYAVPENLFAAQPDGTYTAVAQADNTHAWVEVYQSGIGWIPVEATPGALGTEEQVAMPEDDDNDKSSGNDQEAESDTGSASWLSELLARLMDGSLDSVILCLEAAVILFVVIGLIVRRIWKHRRHLGRQRKLSANENIREIFRAFYEVLVYAGMDPAISSDDPEFAKEVSRICRGVKQSEIRAFYGMVLEAVYGEKTCSEKAVEQARRCYQKYVPAALKGLKIRRRLAAVLWKGY